MEEGQGVATIPNVKIIPLDVHAIPEFISRYLAGEKLEDIAKNCFGCPRSTMMYFILSEIGDEKWSDIKTQVLAKRIAEADAVLENAADILTLKKGEAMAKFARFDFERRRPALYGQKREITTKKRISVFVNRDGKRVEILPPKRGGEIVDISAKAS